MLRYYAYLCRAHDMAHEYSDSHEVWKRGVSELRVIEDLAIKINRPCVTTAIWNDAARNKFVAPWSDQFCKTPKGWKS